MDYNLLDVYDVMCDRVKLDWSPLSEFLDFPYVASSPTLAVPTAWTYFYPNLYLNSAVETGYSIEIFYTYCPDDIAIDEEIGLPSAWQYAVCHYACYAAYQSIRDLAQAAVMLSEFESLVATAQAHVEGNLGRFGRPGS